MIPSCHWKKETSKGIVLSGHLLSHYYEQCLIYTFHGSLALLSNGSLPDLSKLVSILTARGTGMRLPNDDG